MTQSFKEAALAIAQTFPVFPCNPSPLTPNGFYDATQDAATIASWWTRWPNAMIGMPTGQVTGVFAVDVDNKNRKNGSASLVKLTDEFGELPLTITSLTPSGGFHLFFRWPGVEIPNSTSKIASGIDIKGDGGYVIVAPSMRSDGLYYRWSPNGATAFADAPAWLVEQAVAKKKTKTTTTPATVERPTIVPVPAGNATAYGQISLQGEAAKVASAAKGERNSTLNTAAFRLGQLVGGGQLNADNVHAALFQAAVQCGHVVDKGEKQTNATIESGLAAGMQQPRGPQAPYKFDDFLAFLPTHAYIFIPTGELWSAASVNTVLPPVRTGERDAKGNEILISPNVWLDKNRAVAQMTWMPGYPQIIENCLFSDGGWIEKQGVRIFNLYKPPIIISGNKDEAGLWICLVQRLFGEDADHVIKWLAHRVQRPYEKINHALVLGGKQGIGKDTILKPVIYAVGEQNFKDVSPPQILGRFNGYLKAVILRVSEARDLGDTDRFKFYEHLKTYIAAPPDALRIDEKHLHEYYVPNCCGVIITTNHKTDGVHLPADDRRHFVAWSNLEKEDISDAYWQWFHNWLENRGVNHVVACLRDYDLSTFNPKAPPPKTLAFEEIVQAGSTPENAELADALDKLGWPEAVTIGDLQKDPSHHDLSVWLADRKNRRIIPHRMDEVGYVPVKNRDAKDALWKIDGRRQVVYVQKSLSEQARLLAAHRRRGSGQ